MRAVWSFWTTPHKVGRGWHWATEKHHLFSWVLSVELARRHYPDTSLYTDDDGARLLVDGMGLPFEHVCVELNALDRHDPDWWMLGKLLTYQSQVDPFLHIDADVYLWSPLPDRVVSAPVFAQNPEQIDGASCYDVEVCESIIRQHGNGEIPREWQWYREHSPVLQAACCGILGANDHVFIRHYAGTVIELLQNPRNRAAFSKLPDRRIYNPLFEQFVLCACAAYRGITIEYLFDSWDDACSRAFKAGYTHLIGGAKSNLDVANRLEQRIASEYPASYERCLSLAGSFAEVG
jgi:hypothetical protein